MYTEMELYVLPGNVSTSTQDREFSIFSDEERRIIETVNESVLCCVFGLFGMVSNVINMAVFAKQGLHSTINIGLFSMAFSDFAGVTALVGYGICKNPLLIRLDIPWQPTEFSYLPFAWPHGIFARITCWHTAYASAERCICIAVPLKCKAIITPARTRIIVCSIYLVTFISALPQYSSAYIGWKCYPHRNTTLLGLVILRNRELMEGISFFFHTFLGAVSFCAVIIFTAILVIKLKQRTKWRKQSVSEVNVKDLISDKDRKTVKMIILIAAVLIACYTLGIVLGIITFVEPEFSGTGRYSNEFFVSWSFGNVLESVNSSVNIFFFYAMSTRYRTTLRELSTWRKS